MQVARNDRNHFNTMPQTKTLIPSQTRLQRRLGVLLVLALLLPGCTVVETTYDIVAGTVKGAYYVTTGTAKAIYHVGKFNVRGRSGSVRLAPDP